MKKLIIAFALMAPLCSSAQLADSTKRLLHVQGGLNFRDVGGYKTKDGREVRWGKVYRSAAVDKLTDGDVELLKQKHILTVIDFRGTREAAAAPDRLVAGTDYTLCPAGSDSLPDMTKMAKILKEGNFLGKMYGEEGLQYFGDRYRTLFIKLLTIDTNDALMYHCTGGRDRTGMATALFLYILGVPRSTINADFVASNTYLKPMMGKMFEPMAKMTGLSQAQIEKEMNLRPELLDSFFAAINSKYGSVENFMEKEMGIGEKEIAILKQRYTQAI